MFKDLTLDFPQIRSATARRKSGAHSVVYWNVAILACLVLISFLYLVQLNLLGTKGYQINKLEIMVKQLEVEQKYLEVEASSLQSINRIQTESSKLNYVPTTNVSYIKDSDFALK